MIASARFLRALPKANSLPRTPWLTHTRHNQNINLKVGTQDHSFSGMCFSSVFIFCLSTAKTVFNSSGVWRMRAGLILVVQSFRDPTQCV